MGTYNFLKHIVCTHRLNQHIVEPTQDFWEIFLLYRFNLNRSSAIIPSDSTGITYSLPPTISNAPITSSTASVSNFHVFLFFSSKGMYCGMGRKNPRSRYCLSDNHYPNYNAGPVRRGRNENYNNNNNNKNNKNNKNYKNKNNIYMPRVSLVATHCVHYPLIS